MRIHAAVFDRPGTALGVEELTIGEPQPGEVRVKLSASGVCHSDCRVVVGEWQAPTPIVLGHEGAGIVEACGPGVTGLQTGDVVTFSWTPSCRRCRYCVSGRPALCTQASKTAYSNLMPDGTTRLTRGGRPVYSYLSVGSFSQYAVVPESAAVLVGNDVSPAVASLVGCAVTTGVGAVLNTATVEAGATVLVIGCGGVGLSVLMGAKVANADEVIAVDIVESKLELARRIGATQTINSRAQDVLETVRDMTDGCGVDYAFEAIGNSRTIELAYRCLAPGGTAVVVGQTPSGATITIDPMVMSGSELRLIGSNYGSARPTIDFQRILDFHRRRVIDLEMLVSERIALDEVNEALAAMQEGGVAARTVIEFA